MNSDRQSKSNAISSPCEKLVQSQSRLFAYAVTLLADLEAAHDVLQDANRVLLEKLDDYDPSRDFTQWACGFVRTQARAYFRDHARDRLQFSADLIEKIAVEANVEVTESAYRGILRTCLDKLTDHQRMLIELRYTSESNVAGMAKELGRPAPSISTSLNKIRRMLVECTNRLLNAEGLA
ncbi:RNA polymerase sigma factor [Rubripirellula obstinata]|uniref:RNA polymerase sigma factor n=1 Tax=Rubripirellula obstinata TaxID=406547 RepID=A0A5B1CDB3_9BACT|nr:sigma-70 family RNA polymerase sigma factor [Rubripirellula obstinata]KAA1259117.1 RNA polymerase sigma factor [Rubripirellula obstinata]